MVWASLLGSPVFFSGSSLCVTLNPGKASSHLASSAPMKAFLSMSTWPILVGHPRILDTVFRNFFPCLDIVCINNFFQWSLIYGIVTFPCNVISKPVLPESNSWRFVPTCASFLRLFRLSIVFSASFTIGLSFLIDREEMCSPTWAQVVSQHLGVGREGSWVCPSLCRCPSQQHSAVLPLHNSHLLAGFIFHSFTSNQFSSSYVIHLS